MRLGIHHCALYYLTDILPQPNGCITLSVSPKSRQSFHYIGWLLNRTKKVQGPPKALYYSLDLCCQTA